MSTHPSITLMNHAYDWRLCARSLPTERERMRAAELARFLDELVELQLDPETDARVAEVISRALRRHRDTVELRCYVEGKK